MAMSFRSLPEPGSANISTLEQQIQCCKRMRRCKWKGNRRCIFESAASVSNLWNTTWYLREISDIDRWENGCYSVRIFSSLHCMFQLTLSLDHLEVCSAFMLHTFVLTYGKSSIRQTNGNGLDDCERKRASLASKRVPKIN